MRRIGLTGLWRPLLTAAAPGQDVTPGKLYLLPRTLCSVGSEEKRADWALLTGGGQAYRGGGGGLSDLPCYCSQIPSSH